MTYYNHDFDEGWNAAMQKVKEDSSASPCCGVELGNPTLYMLKPRANAHETQFRVNLAYDSEEEAMKVYDALKAILHHNSHEQPREG